VLIQCPIQILHYHC